MPTTIRHATFETNSSSVHALVYFTPEQEKLFAEDGYYLFFPSGLWEDQNVYSVAARIAPNGMDWLNVPERECLEQLQGNDGLEVGVVEKGGELSANAGVVLVHPDEIHELIDEYTRDEVDRMISGIPGGWSTQADVDEVYADGNAFNAECGVTFENEGTSDGRRRYHMRYYS